MLISADKPSMENHGLHTAFQWRRSDPSPSLDRLQAAAEILNAGNKLRYSWAKGP